MKLDKNKKYVFAVSGGPDSMAMLDMAVKDGIKAVVCHVNYQKRAEADKEMLAVIDFCKKHQLKYFVLNEKYNYKGNFQAFARDYRYRFFVKVLKEEKLDGIVVAHHEDDLLETYLMQKQKKLEPYFYGLSEVSCYEGFKVYRPLLSYTKQELMDYCNKNKLEYFIDASNFSMVYTRNKVRHQLVFQMTKLQRQALKEEINKLNEDKKTVYKKVVSLTLNNKVLYKDLLLLDERESFAFLRMWFKRHIGDYVYSQAFLLEVLKAFKNGKNTRLLIHDFLVIKNYEWCEIVGNADKSYCFIIKSNEAMQTPYFKISDKGKKIEGISVGDDEWPLTIRNFLPGDKIKLGYGTKKVSRWFIDRKIPVYLRKIWPVVLNNRNEIIMVPEIGCDIYHYTIKPNIFVIK